MCKILVALIFVIRAVYARNDIAEYLGKNVKVAQCRAACIEEFSTGLIKSNYHRTSNYGCTTKTNWKCNMCWDYCDMLSMDERTNHQMCSDEICMDGCKYACQFYFKEDKSGVGEGKLEVYNTRATRGKITWSYRREVFSDEIPVFVVLGLKGNNQWVQLGQTADTRIELDAEVPKLKKITIVAVSENGLLGLCSKKLLTRYRYRRQALENLVEKKSDYENNFFKLFHTRRA